MSMLDYLLCWLITFGFAFSFAITPGPFAWFERVRYYAQDKYGVNSWQAHGVQCPICISFYVSIPVAIGIGGGNAVSSVLLWLSAFGFVTVAMALAPD